MLHTVVALGDIFYSEPQSLRSIPIKNGFAVYDSENTLQSYFSSDPFDYLYGNFELQKKQKEIKS